MFSEQLMRVLTLLGFPKYYDRLTSFGVGTFEGFLHLTLEDLTALYIRNDRHETLLRTISIL